MGTSYTPGILKRTLRFVLCLVLVSAALPLMAAPVAEIQESPATRLVTDVRGRKVEVPREIERILALEANSLRLLSYFDAIEKVVAVEDTGHAREKTYHQFFNLATYRLAFPSLRELPSIGSSSNHEAIIAAQPDIVFSSTIDVGQLDHLQQILGIPVFGIDADIEMNAPKQFLAQFTLMGEVLSEKGRATDLVAGIERIMEDLAARKQMVNEPKRAYAGGMMYYGPADLLRTTGDYDPFYFTGAQNVMPTNPANNRQPYMTSLEDLVKANPSVIFIDAANESLSKRGYQAQKELLDEQVDAFRSKEIHTTLVYKYYGTNWENQIINCYYVGKTLYPDLYADIDIIAKAEEIWELFFNVPLSYEFVSERQAPAFGLAPWF